MHVVLWRRALADWDTLRSAHFTRRAADRALRKERRRYHGCDFRIERHSIWIKDVFIVVALKAIVWSLLIGMVAVALVLATT